MRSLKRINRYNRNLMRSGYWEYYHEDGELEAKGYYKDGLRVGIWDWYN